MTRRFGLPLSLLWVAACGNQTPLDAGHRGPLAGDSSTGAAGAAAGSTSGGGGSGGTAGSAIGGDAGMAGAPATAGSPAGGSMAGGGAGAAGGPAGGESGAANGGAAPTAGSSGTSGAAGSAGAGAGNAAGSAGAGGGPTTRPARVLLYSFSTLEIESVPAQLAIFEDKLEGWQYEVDRSEDPAVFTDESLAQYAAVGMINTCFYPFGQNEPGVAESQALQRFLQEGGGLFGTHCADVTFQSANPPALYNELIGGRASSQNFEGDSDCRKTGDHPTTSGLPDTFAYTGNLDNTDFLATDSVVLVSCKWGTANGPDVAVSWVRMEGTGRVFYTNFAKVDADLEHPTIGEPHIIAGLGWVLGR